MTPGQKKAVMWFTIFMIAFPMPLIIYYGLKAPKPPAVKSDCGKIPSSKMTDEQRKECTFDSDEIPNPLKFIPFFRN